MAKKKREVPEINSSSTADIAFLLLIFFLITTSMDTDRGLARRLPPPPEKDQKLDDAKKKERNVLQVFLNMQDQLMCGNDYITVDQLRAKAKEFIANPYNEDTKPEKISKNVPFFGTVQVTEGHVISLRCVMNWLRKSGRRIIWSWIKNNKMQFVKFILRRFLRQNLKSTEKRSNGKI